MKTCMAPTARFGALLLRLVLVGRLSGRSLVVQSRIARTAGDGIALLSALDYPLGSPRHQLWGPVGSMPFTGVLFRIACLTRLPI